VRVHADTRPLTVLLSLSPPDGTTRYVDQVVGGAAPNVSYRFFTWRAAFSSRYNVFHVHWPELLVRHDNRLKAFLLRRALGVLLLLLRIRRVPIVRTIHNLRPHESGHSAEVRVLDAVDRRTRVFIRLNPTSALPSAASADAHTVTILHGHYRDRFRTDTRSVPGRLVNFGLIRPYKGVETLLAAFRALEDPDLTLRIAGRPSGGLREVIEREQTKDPRVSSVLRFVSDDELVEEVAQGELVVLPYRQMHNSGAILVALSLARPALVPASAANAVLAAEVGVGWVHQYQGTLTPEILGNTLESIRVNPPASPPRLDGRDWATLGLAHRDAYVRALDATRGEREAAGAQPEPVR
jgi:beta-1,4-mannosyltransferase